MLKNLSVPKSDRNYPVLPYCVTRWEEEQLLSIRLHRASRSAARVLYLPYYRVPGVSYGLRTKSKTMAAVSIRNRAINYDLSENRVVQ